MGLFTTLTNAAPTKSSLDLPTVVQLYAQEAITFDASPKAAPLPYYATLSYSAVAMAPPEQIVAATPLNKKKQQTVPDPVPELGVWNVRIHNNAPNLLTNVPSKCQTYVLTVDLAQPHQVAPNMTLLQNALVRHLKERNVNAVDALPFKTNTTSLYDLQSAQFGVAPKDSAEHAAVEEPDVKDRDVTFCVIVLAKLSKTKDAAPDHYRDQQMQALLTYHLYKFACQLKASLIFVNGEDESVDAESEDSSGMNTIVPISTPLQVAAILKDLAQGIVAAKPPALTLASPAGSSAAEEKHDNDDKDGGDSTPLPQVEASHELSMYAPDNVDVIDSVLLRNASFPGQWDATTTSLLKILPPPLESSSSNNAAAFPKPNPSVGDQGWLKELHDSVAARGEKTPLKAAKQQEAKDDKDVSSFFSSLLG